jgi:hypothetical protein
LKRGNQVTGIFENTYLVFKHEEINSKDSISILGGHSQPLYSVSCDHSMKMPKMWGNVPTNRQMRSTDVRIGNKDGILLGEIHEIPTGTMRLIRKWEVFNGKGICKGVVVEAPKFIGSDWALESSEGNLLAVTEGDRKKNNYEIVTPDKGKQCIARCTSLNEDSYRVELMISNIDSFLVLSYVIVLDLAKTAAVIRRRGF